jgi:hypothetical protein
VNSMVVNNEFSTFPWPKQCVYFTVLCYDILWLCFVWIIDFGCLYFAFESILAIYLHRCLMKSSFCYAFLYRKILSTNMLGIKQSISFVKLRCKTNTFLKTSTRYFWFHYNTSLWLKDNFYVHSHGPNLHFIVNRNPSNLELHAYDICRSYILSHGR